MEYKIDSNMYNAVVIGGGASGLSAAMVLARANRKVLVVDAGKQSNKVSHGAHSIFSRDKIKPQELYNIAREQLLQYKSVSILDTTVKSVVKNDHFEIMLEGGQKVTAKAIILAQGLLYTLPEIEGLQEMYGTKAWHCPFCDGYEANGKKLLSIHDKKDFEHMKELLSNWTEDIIWAEPHEIERLESVESGVKVVMKDGSEFEVNEVNTMVTLKQRDEIADSLGCKRKDNCLIVDEFYRTSVEGVYAAGDQTTDLPQVNIAIAAGHKAGTRVVKDIGR